MRKIANTTELQTELRQILAYAQSERPSRARIATALGDLSTRVAADSARVLSDYVTGHLDKAFTAFYDGVGQALRDARKLDDDSRGKKHAVKAAEALNDLVRGELDNKFDRFRGIVEGNLIDTSRG